MFKLIKIKKNDEINNNNILPSQQKIPNNNLSKEDDKPSEEDYTRYNEYFFRIFKKTRWRRIKSIL